MHDEEGSSDEEQSSAGSLAPALDESATAQDQLPGSGASLITEQAVASRAALMFTVGAAGPAASGLPRQAPKATKLFVKLAATYVNDLKKVAMDALSAAYGNFDRLVGLWWLLLLAEAVGLPLLTRETAYAVGLKARREAGYIQAPEAAKKKDLGRAKSKLAATDPRRLQLDGEHKDGIMALLRDFVDVALPSASLPSAPSAVTSSATGSRKRKREAESSFDELIADAEVELLKAEKVAKKASAEVDQSEVKVVQAQKIADRMLDKIDTAASKQAGKFLKLALARSGEHQRQHM